jgi:hypothetical protein
MAQSETGRSVRKIFTSLIHYPKKFFQFLIRPTSKTRKTFSISSFSDQINKLKHR